MLSLASAAVFFARGPAFTPSRLPSMDSLSRAELIACHAEADTEVAAPPAEKIRYVAKRDRRGTLCFARRELNEEAWRMAPYVEPLLDQHMSIKEITFALNRQGSELRHLLYRPRLGLPVFTEHKVRRILRRNKTDKGRLNNFARPRFLPPNAPGAPYPSQIGDVFAEVPPLAPWTATTITTVLVKEAAPDWSPAAGKICVEESKGLFLGDDVKVGDETGKITSITWVGDGWEISFEEPLKKTHAVGTTLTKN